MSFTDRDAAGVYGFQRGDLTRTLSSISNPKMSRNPCEDDAQYYQAAAEISQKILEVSPTRTHRGKKGKDKVKVDKIKSKGKEKEKEKAGAAGSMWRFGKRKSNDVKFDPEHSEGIVHQDIGPKKQESRQIPTDRKSTSTSHDDIYEENDDVYSVGSTSTSDTKLTRGSAAASHYGLEVEEDHEEVDGILSALHLGASLGTKDSTSADRLLVSNLDLYEQDASNGASQQRLNNEQKKAARSNYSYAKDLDPEVMRKSLKRIENADLEEFEMGTKGKIKKGAKLQATSSRKGGCIIS